MDNLAGDNQRHLESKVLTIDQTNQSRQEESRVIPKGTSQDSKNHPGTCDGKSEYEKIQSLDHNTKKKLLKTRGNFILRQEIKSYTPECNAICGIISNLLIALACIAVGIPSVYFSDKAREYTVEYTKW